jgi:hypothetical protein
MDRMSTHELFVCSTHKGKRKSYPCALTEHHAMKAYWGSGSIAPLILCPRHWMGWVVSFTPTERAPGTHWIGGWVGPRAVLDMVVKRKIPSPSRNSDRPARIPALYQLSYHGSIFSSYMSICNFSHIYKFGCCPSFINCSSSYRKRFNLTAFRSPFRYMIYVQYLNLFSFLITSPNVMRTVVLIMQSPDNL